MKQTPPKGTAEQHVREIRRQTRKKYSALREDLDRDPVDSGERAEIGRDAESTNYRRSDVRPQITFAQN